MGFGVSSTGLPAARRRQGMTTPDSRHLTADERRTLALGAASVFERAAPALPAGAPRSDAFTPSDHALGVLRTWIQAFSPGNPEAFERRLTWDDLSLADVAAAAARVADEDLWRPLAYEDGRWRLVGSEASIAVAAPRARSRDGAAPPLVPPEEAPLAEWLAAC